MLRKKKEDSNKSDTTKREQYAHFPMTRSAGPEKTEKGKYDSFGKYATGKDSKQGEYIPFEEIT